MSASATGPRPAWRVSVSEAVPSGRNPLRRTFGIATEWSTYADLLYLLLGLPIGIASWTALVTLLAVGGGLAVTVVGIPLLLLTMYAWCFAADAERLLSNTLLDTRIRPLPFGSEHGTRWRWPRLKARLRNAHTWRALVFLLVVRFPLGIAGFAVLSSTALFALRLVFEPLAVALGLHEQVLGWTIDTGPEAVLAAGCGVLLLVPSLYVVRVTAWATGLVNTFFLQSPETSTPQPQGEALDRALTAAVRWPGTFARRAGDAARRERSLQVRIWAFHMALYGAVMAVLALIDAAFSNGQWWVVWPAWGWGIALALHTGYLLGGHLGGHALAFVVTNIGLFVIDVRFAESTWFFWPLVAWAIAVAAHAYAYFVFAPVEAEPRLEAFVTEPPLSAASRATGSRTLEGDPDNESPTPYGR